MDKPQIRIYLPELWNQIYQHLIFDVPEEADWTIDNDELLVAGTGPGGKEYDRAIIDSKNGNIPILVLPVAHCVYNISARNLVFLGPFTKTRNDVYAYRTREYSKPTGKFIVGVIGKELTTSNISRVVIHNWPPSTYSFHEDLTGIDIDESFLEALASIRGKMIGKVRHRGRIRNVDIDSVEKRIEYLIKGEIDVALLTGKELDRKEILEDGRILLATDLNQVICNLYNTNYFPRTLLAVFEEDFQNNEKYKAINEFLNCYNRLVKNLYAIADITSERQQVCLSGAESKYGEINILIKFTNDMKHAIKYGDEDTVEGFEVEPLQRSHFIHWDRIAYTEIIKMTLLNTDINIFNQQLVKSLRKGPKGEKKFEEFEILKQNALMELQQGSSGFTMDMLINNVNKMRSWEGLEKKELSEYLKKVWKDTKIE